MSRFEKVTDAAGVHIITRDTLTELEWTARDLGEFTNKAEDSKAESVCMALDLGGYTDWRLPTVDELETIRDRTRSHPAIDTEFFPDCPSDWLWTSTPYAASPSEFAWVVGFSYGNSGVNGRVDGGRVRAVRGSSRQSSASLPAETSEAALA